MFSMPSGSEWLIVLVLVMIFFGVGKLPDVFKQLGKGVKAFKDASTKEEEEEAAAPKKSSRQIPRSDDLDEEEAKTGSRSSEKSRA